MKTLAVLLFLSITPSLVAVAPAGAAEPRRDSTYSGKLIDEDAGDPVRGSVIGKVGDSTSKFTSLVVKRVGCTADKPPPVDFRKVPIKESGRFGDKIQPGSAPLFEIEGKFTSRQVAKGMFFDNICGSVAEFTIERRDR